MKNKTWTFVLRKVKINDASKYQFTFFSKKFRIKRYPKKFSNLYIDKLLQKAMVKK